MEVDIQREAIENNFLYSETESDEDLKKSFYKA
jgi:hypothetical protein